jgi:hypothetical protein
MDIQEKIETIALAVVGIICIAISILDFTGALDSIKWLADRIVVMNLLALGAVAFYLVLERSRGFRRLETKILSGHNEILKKLVPAGDEARIIDQVNFLWSERESGIRKFFDQVSLNLKHEDDELLADFLQTTFKKFNNGDVFGAKVKFPWDFTITAINLHGDFIYHPDESNISTKATHMYPYNEIINRRNGEVIFVNHGRSEQFSMMLPVLNSIRTYRFTKFYFREFEYLRAILVFESHINAVYQLPLREENKPRV